MLCWQDRGRLRLECMHVAELNVLCARVSRGRGEERRLARGAKLLRRAGVRRVLLNRDCRPELPGLAVVDGLPLHRALADRLVLAALARKGIPPERATVVLRGEYPDSDLSQTARALCPQVRQVVVDTRSGGAILQRSLLQQFGVAVGPVKERKEVLTVRFGGRGGEEDIVLCGQVKTAGLAIDLPELVLPETLVRASVLCALWQEGLLKVSQIQIVGAEEENKCT